MAWIKSHPHLLVLILVALAVLGGSGFVWKSAQDFDHNFDVVRQQPVKGTKIPKQDPKPLEDAASEFQKPAAWSPAPKYRSLFVSIPLMPNADNTGLTEPSEGALVTDSLTGKPIPNQWFFQNKLSPFKKGVGINDTDGDGFWADDEWRAGTDPQDKESHPAYLTKLFFFKYIKIAFFLSFKTVNGDPKKPETLDFQINTTAMGRGSVFLKLGEMVPKTNFKLDKYEQKQGVTPNGTEVDVSELTLINTVTGVPLVLVINRPTDSPDSYINFHYLWPDPYKPRDISLQKGKEFALPNEPDIKYKVLDIDETKAVIQLPSGEKLEILPAPAGYPPKQ